MFTYSSVGISRNPVLLPRCKPEKTTAVVVSCFSFVILEELQLKNIASSGTNLWTSLQDTKLGY